MATPKKIGIVGAGTMGAGIAQKTAQSGLDVVLMDLKQEFVDRGLAAISKMLHKGVERGVFREGEPERVLGRITGTTSHADLAGCDLIVEAVFEDLGVKRALLAELEKHVRPDCVLATNTSSFKVSAVAEGALRPERIVGLHYFFHPAQNRLLEVIPGKATSRETLQRAWAFAEATGKTAISSADAPGFVVNRFFVPWLNESVRLLEEGVADLVTIEETCKRFFGIGMGPFVLMNVTGVPIAKHACEGLASELGPFYAPCDLLKKQVESRQNWAVEGEPSDKGVAAVEERMLGVVLLVAASLVDEGVSSAEDTDIGAMVGLRWPHGPFALANHVGIERAVAATIAVAHRYDLAPPPSLKGRTAPFDLQAVSLAVEHGLARITMNRPNAMNALDPETVASLARAFDAAAADPAATAIVLEG
ncbi:MAG TPA: 3-hydroxyacyl-CoA dehydrogenase NAD-binding domain-containing protein, partial [Polyangia bacterium]|nr:3-hydroxyacyl-CoA dehydrogenase NAD-binding domain-containing protein [Polyangia bacterium]